MVNNILQTFILYYSNVSQTCFRRGTAACDNEKKCMYIKRWLLARGDYSSISNRRTKLLAIFEVSLYVFAVFQNSYAFTLFLAGTLTCSMERTIAGNAA
jgi:hypothetical protein